MGLLQPFPVRLGPWKSISMDFITDLPSTKGYDAILTVVDRFTRMEHFLPRRRRFTSQETTNLVIPEVFKHHGLPNEIISDHEPQFIAICLTYLRFLEFLVKSFQVIVVKLMVKLNAKNKH